MSREIPEVVRAAAGLAATVLDEARKLPETLPGLPVRVIGMAMQQAMKVQQQYAGLVARGDELFTGIRGEDEPGLATFDDDVEPVTVTPPGFRDSAFDRAAETSASDPATYAVTEDGEEIPADPPADAVTSAVDELADQVETGQQSIEELAEEAPAIAEILDEIAIDELVDQAPTLDETAPTTDTLDAEPTADVATTVDVLTAEAEVTPVDATVTDEGIAAPESAAPDTAAESTADEGGAHGRDDGETTAAPTDDAAGSSAALRFAGRRGRAHRRLRQLLDRAAAWPAARLRAEHGAGPRRLRGGHPGPRAVPEDAAQPAGEARGAGHRIQPAGPARRLSVREPVADPSGTRQPGPLETRVRLVGGAWHPRPRDRPVVPGCPLAGPHRRPQGRRLDRPPG